METPRGSGSFSSFAGSTGTRLRDGVRRSLITRSTVGRFAALVGGCLVAADVEAALFPAEIDLAALLEANGGDGTIGWLTRSDDDERQSWN